MNWQQRITQILLAGGTIATAAGCGEAAKIPGGVCNANPDPCCNNQAPVACRQLTECRDGGGTFVDYDSGTCHLPDGGTFVVDGGS